jgi:hypothetical protein
VVLRQPDGLPLPNVMRRWPSNDLGITDIKTNLSITAFSVAVVAFALAFTISAQPTQPVAGTPSSLSPTELAERALERHAVEAIIWGMPAVNFDLMYQAMIHDAKGAGSNKVVYWSKLSDFQMRAWRELSRSGMGPGKGCLFAHYRRGSTKLRSECKILIIVRDCTLASRLGKQQLSKHAYEGQPP